MPGKPARPIAKAELPLEGGQLSALVSGDSYFLGTCEEAGVSALYDHLGVSTPPDCLALPIRVGPRAALLLLADNAAQPVDHRALPIATVVVRQLSAALERLIRTIKSRHTSAIPGVNAEAPAHLSADAAPIHEEPSRITQELLLRVEGQAAGVTAGLNAFDSTEWALPEDWDDVDALQTAPEGGPARQTRLFGAFEQPQRGAIDPDPASERERASRRPQPGSQRSRPSRRRRSASSSTTVATRSRRRSSSRARWISARRRLRSKGAPRRSRRQTRP